MSVDAVIKRIRRASEKAFKDALLSSYPARTSPSPRNKVATARTRKSVEAIAKTSLSKFSISVYAAKSWNFIEYGRKPNGKRPVYKVGSRFRLFPDLEEWKQAVNYKGSDFMLAKGIAERGIKPTPITDTGIGLFNSRIDVDAEITNLALDSFDSSIFENFKLV